MPFEISYTRCQVWSLGLINEEHMKLVKESNQIWRHPINIPNKPYDSLRKPVEGIIKISKPKK